MGDGAPARWQDDLYDLLRRQDVTQFAFRRSRDRRRARLFRAGNGAAFVVLRVRPNDPPACKRTLDPASCRNRFRSHLLRAG
jgi:phosphonopyruvate decarboxylase